MGCCLSCLVCEAASCAVSGACKCCGKVIPGSVIGGRIAYTITFFVVSFISWILSGWANKILDWVPVLKHACKEDICFGALAVYRVSFSLALFHLVMAAIVIGVKYKGDCRIKIQDGFWLVKIAAIAGIVIATFFIPNALFEYYGWVALVASGVFILVQLIFLIDFAHSWAESWIGKMENDTENERRWWWLLFSVSIALLLVTLAITITMYAVFTKDPSKCGQNVAFITLNLLFCFVICVTSIHPKVQEQNPKSGLLQPAIISAYCTYLIFSAIQSETDGCNPWKKSATSSNTSLLLGAIFTICAVCYATISASSKMGNDDSSETESLVKGEEGNVNTEEESTEEEKHTDPDEPVAYNFSRFHFIFALGAMYVCMLMTDWRTVWNPGNTGDGTPIVDSGAAAVWVKVVSSWLCVALYLWTLIAPALFPDRDWS